MNRNLNDKLVEINRADKFKSNQSYMTLVGYKMKVQTGLKFFPRIKTRECRKISDNRDFRASS